MTNNWTDIGNSTLVVAMGANPTENHPACMAHINRAREELNLTDTDGTVTGTVGAKYKKIYDRAGNSYVSRKAPAKLVVIDPRKTRTAAQADLYVRIRPGTDIAFINGLVNYILDVQGVSTGLKAPANANKLVRFEAYHQATAAKSLRNDAGAAVNVTRPKYSDASFKVTTTDYVRSTQTIGADTFTALPEVAYKADGVTPDINASGTVLAALKSHVASYDVDTVANICGCSRDEIIEVANLMIENSRAASVVSDTDAFAATVNDPRGNGFKSMTMLYAMGITQHTCGSQNVKSFAVLQQILGNMGRCGGGINALRGIHNVQGSTDMGLLYGNIPAYSGNPSGTFGAYMNGLYGARLNGTAGDGTVRDPYVFANGGLQQKGFYSMTKAWFGDNSWRGTWAAGHEETASAVADTQANIDGLYALWPKGNGDNHVKMIQKMLPTYAGADKIKACVNWGQNPCITEPNQANVRAAFKELDMLVCVDLYANETAMTDRKASGVTYLIPACSHVEEPGSVTNSGRVLQWRYAARAPQGNSKTDLELLMRFAKALDGAGAFNHIKQKWQDLGVLGGNAADAWAVLFGNQYGWTWGSAFDADAVAKKIYKQMCAPQNNGGTIWIYLEAWDTNTTTRGAGWPDATGKSGSWVNGANVALGSDFPIRAMSRIGIDADGASNPGGHLLYKNWGYAWLVNRRVLYNNSDVPGDQGDGFQGPDLVSRLFVSTNSSVIDYSTAYRTIHRLSDKPLTPTGVLPTGATYAGRFPWHTEPYESPRKDLVDRWGKNSVVNTKLVPQNAADGYMNLFPADTPKADDVSRADYSPLPGTGAAYPLVLTTIRCVEHFQGGPITRNNIWNSEVEPEPWIEIHSADARALGIADGDWVNVITARSNSTTDQVARTANTVPSTTPALDNFGKGFRARVGVGADSNQRVARGVVAIPWHWGESGLSTGARANDLCIDAMDANTTIPESKACLCKIVKA